jgi:hypothetical protein
VSNIKFGRRKACTERNNSLIFVVCISDDYCIFSLQVRARCMMLKIFKFFCHVKESVRYMNLGRKAIVQIARPPSPTKLLKDSKL